LKVPGDISGLMIRAALIRFSAGLRILIALAAVIVTASAARAEKVDCRQCHAKLLDKKFIHTAVTMGCQSCHTGVDASEVPHTFTGEKGLSAQPPDLCFQCHTKDAFTKKIRHAPVAEGNCLACHTPHSSSNESLLTAQGNELCLQCHPDVGEKPHAVTRYERSGHVLSGTRDPKRPGKPFGCTSCHVPHASNWGKLFRYEAKDASGLCKYCHSFMM
jgi:predicted CXXCH cytochrome family protein